MVLMLSNKEAETTYTSSSLSPVSASLFESINTIQYNDTLPLPDHDNNKSHISNIIKDSTYTTGNSYSPTTPVFATKSETCDSPVSQYVSVSELSPAPASPETATPAHVEAMLTTLQPFNPNTLMTDNQGFVNPPSLFSSYSSAPYNQYSTSPYYSAYSTPPVSLKWN